MERLVIGPWTLEIDRKKTAEFYQQHHLITDDCSCHYCANYSLACENFSQEVLDMFKRLAIDPKKEGEVFTADEKEDGTLLYSGFYHVIGRIVHGPDGEMALVDGLPITFSKETDLVPEGFPEPVLQWDFEMDVPWLLDEEEKR